MEFATVKSNIESLLQPVLVEKNFFLVEVRFSMGKKIEVYIDSDEGIRIEDCAVISRFLEKHLDSSGTVPDNYILEVSSPGMDNPLKVPRQYKKRIGRILEVVKSDGTRIEAQLEEADDEKIRLKEVLQQKKKKHKPEIGEQQPEEAREYSMKYDEIKRAVLQFKF